MHSEYRYGIEKPGVVSGLGNLSGVRESNLQKPSNMPGDGAPVFNSATESVETEYVVQPGDTFAIIAARLGLTGSAAKEYAKNLKAKLQAEGQLNEKGWMMAGQKIKLIGDYSKQLNNMADYTTDKKEISNKYKEITTGKRSAPTVESVRAMQEKAPATPSKVKDEPESPQHKYFNYNPYQKNNNGTIPYLDAGIEPDETYIYPAQRKKVEMPTKPVKDVYKKLKEPVKPIKIDRPKYLSSIGNEFADALENKNNKEKLMAICGLTNDEYNRYVQLALGIVHEETHYGDGLLGTNIDTGSIDIQWRNFRKQVADSIGYIDYLYESGQRTGSKSIGISQIKYGDFITPNKDGSKSTIQKQFEKMGIMSQEDLENSIENQAVATIIVLHNKGKIANNEDWQKAIKTYNEKTNNGLTTERVITMLYNGNVYREKLEDGTQEMGVYGDNVLRVADKFKITSGKADIPQNSKVEKNNGPLGKVIFMPKLYRSGVRNTESARNVDIAMLNKLQKRSFIKERDELIQAVKDGRIGFGGGLTHAEMASLTKEDVQLILLELNQYEIKAHEAKSNAERCEIAMHIEDEFREEYLSSKAMTVKEKNINRHATGYSTKLRGTDIVDERLISDRKSGVLKAHVRGYKRKGTPSENGYINTIRSGNYKGFYVEADKGVNPYYADGSLIPKNDRILAECASAVARDMNIGGRCLTGAKQSFIDSGVAKKEEFVYPDWHPKAGKTIKEPRDMPLYFEAHPEKFEEVKYVEIGGGNAREITASDIFNLPAGYTGIFIPGPGYEDQAGHIFITNGNGQGYADEVDNLRWDNFVSGGTGNGKGENGTFKIYRLRNV